MASIGALVIDLVAKTGKFETDMGRAARAAEKRSKDIDRSISRMTGRITGAFAGIAAAFSFKKIIDATSQAESALAKLDNAVRNNAGAAGVTTQELAAFSSELQSLTTYGDESIQEMQSLLLTFRQIGGPELKRAQVAVLDLATALGTDLNSAAKLIGRALADPVRGMTQLSRSGVVLDETTKNLVKSLAESGRLSEAQGILLRELENRFSGAAQAARNTFGGALTGLKNAFGDLLEAKGGMPDAVENLNALSALLQDHATVAAANALTSALIKGFTGVAGAIAETTNVTRFWAEELASRLSGPAIDDVARMSDEIERIQKVLNSNPLTDSEFLNRITLFGEGGLIEWWSDDELRARMAELRKRIDDALNTPQQNVVSTAGGASGAATPAPPSEEFVKLSDRLKEQIALHGRVGEAAKIAYALQVGALEDVTEAEGKQLLALARRYDAIVDNAAIQKQEAEAQKQAQSSIDSMLSSLQQQVKTYDQGETAVIAYRIAHGDLADEFSRLGDAAGPYRDQIVQLTKDLENLRSETEAQQKLEKDREQLFARGASITEAVRTPLEAYQSTLQDLNTLLDEGAVSYETYGRALEKAQEQLDEATNKWTVFKDQAARNTQDIIADTLVNGFDDGAKGVLKAFGEMLKQMAEQAVAADIASRIFGKSGGGEGSGWIGALVGLFGGGRATGGPVNAGTMYRVNEREPEYFRPNVGGKVIPLSKMPGMQAQVTVQNSFHISAPTGSVSAQTQQQVASAAFRGVSLANRRNN